ncbi:hypothetical protein [Blautia sp.]|uniref:hypothetical protein n=1 Tax=Blautia sp. TaxID=1955243 RepID=UPI003AB65D90
MKKIMITLMVILTLLCGCQANENTNAFDYGDDISKAQEIAVVSPETEEVMDTITGAEDIKDFVLALEVEKWKLETLPEEATEIGSFGLAQEETIKLGQTDTDGTLFDIATITLYDGDYISFEIVGLDMAFEVSEETADYLNGYFE